MNIRSAEEKDAKSIMKFELELFQKWDEIDQIDKINVNWFNSDDHFNRTINTIRDKSKKIILAFEKETCVGYLKAEIKEREPFLQKVGYISEIYIVKEMRTKGIGSLLLNDALRWFRSNNVTWTTVSTHSKDLEAIAFWEKKGYKEFNKFFKMSV